MNIYKISTVLLLLIIIGLSYVTYLNSTTVMYRDFEIKKTDLREFERATYPNDFMICDLDTYDCLELRRLDPNE